MALLKASSLKKSYKSRTVVSDVSLQVETGQVVGLLGPNGAGKTTSFYMIVGLVRCEPCLDGFAVMHAKIVEDQEHFLVRAVAIDHQRFEKLDQFLVVERAIDDHPARLALIGHGGNHR